MSDKKSNTDLFYTFINFIALPIITSGLGAANGWAFEWLFGDITGPFLRSFGLPAPVTFRMYHCGAILGFLTGFVYWGRKG